MSDKEYIEREAVLKVLHHRIPINEYDKSLFCDGGNVCLSLLEEFVEQLPTADVAEVKHGEWERKFDEQGIDRGYKCSACRNYVYQMTYEPYVFCPHCGARMDGKEKKDA